MRGLQERRPVFTALKSTGPAAALAAAVVAADQATKTWALHHTAGGRHVVGTLWLDLTFNSGAAFGLGTGVTPVIEVVAVVLVGALVIFSRRARRAGRLSAAAVGLLVGGAAGNLADRVFRHVPGHPGAVVDFIAVARVGHHDWWPVFNVADAAITVGAVILAVALSRAPARTRAGRRGRGR